MSGWAAAAQAGMELANTWMASSAQHKANRTNIMLAREQREWEKDLANTAIQRRAADFEAAGFNRLLAATGPGAATPSVAAPQVDPNYRADWAKGLISTAMMLKAQMDETKARTQNISADTRNKTNEARITEEFAARLKGIEVQKGELDLKHVQEKIRETGASADLTAAQKAKLDQALPHMIQLLKQEARQGELDLEAMENIAEMGGVEFIKGTPTLKLLWDLFRSMRGGK